MNESDLNCFHDACVRINKMSQFDIGEFQNFCDLVSASKDMQIEDLRGEKYDDVVDRIATSALHLENVIWNARSLGTIADIVKRFVYYADDKQKKSLYTTDDYPYNAEDEKKLEHLSDRLKYMPRLLHAFLGIVSEVGELADAIIKYIETGKLDEVNTKEELGDIGWYLCEGATGLHCKLSDILSKIQAKLEKRYKEKQKQLGFTNEKAVDRDLDEERKVLEGDK